MDSEKLNSNRKKQKSKRSSSVDRNRNAGTVADNNIAVDIRSVTKKYRIHHEKNPSLKGAIIRWRKASYEEFLAVDNITLSIGHRETIGLIGPNGSGKSTILKMIAKILKPTSGEIVINGTISALLELGAGFHPDLTGRENIYINSAILGMKRKEIDRRFNDIVEFSELQRFIDMPVKNYSSGMYMRLGFSIAINVNPEILLIDEVLAVGDQSFQAKCYKVIYDFMKKGKTIIIVSHDLETISDLCSRVIFLKNGKIEDSGDSLKVVTNYRAYVEEMEMRRITEQQKDERKKIFKSLKKGRKKVVSGDEIEKISKSGFGDEVVNRFGSGEAEIKKIELLDLNDKKLDFCRYGDNVKIVYEVKFNSDVEGPVFGLRISDYKNNVIYGTNSKLNNVRSGMFKKGDLVRVIFNLKINMIGGTYYVTAAVSYKDGKTYCDWINNLIDINIMDNKKAEGISDLNSEISIKKI